MAGSLASAVLGRAQRLVPDLADTVAGYEYLNKVHRQLIIELPLRVTSRDVSVTANTSEYALTDAELRVWSAEWVLNANTRYDLRENEVTWLNLNRRGWRDAPAQSRPNEYYIWSNTTGRVVGLYPTPSVTTAAGYPVLRIHVSEGQTLTSGDTVLAALQSEDVYVYGMAARYGDDIGHDRTDYFYEKYLDALRAEREFWFGRNVRSKPAILPGWVPQGRVV